MKLKLITLPSRHALGIVLATGLFLECTSPTVRSEVIAYEGFRYLSGVHLDTQGGGFGWNGAWFKSPLENNHNTVGSPGWTAANVLVSGNRMRQSGLDNRTFRYLDTSRAAITSLVCTGSYGSATFGKHGTTVWIAFLMNMTSGSAYCGIHLTDDLEPAIDKYGDKKHQRIQMGRNNLGLNYYLGRVTNGGPGSGKWDSAVLVNATIRLVVYRFDFKDPAEEAWMWIDPPPGPEPDTASAALHATGITHFCFNAVSVGGNAVCNIDELRVATTYAEAVPSSAFGISALSWTPATTVISWHAAPGNAYVLRRAVSLAPLPVVWTNIGGEILADHGTASAVDNSPPAGRAFYEVVVP